MRSSGRGARLIPCLAPGFVEQLAQFDAAAVDGDVGPTQMVAQQVIGLLAGTHHHVRAAGVVVLSDRTVIVALVMVAHVDRGRRTEGGLDPVAVSVVDKRGRGRAADARQPVLGVVATYLALSTNRVDQDMKSCPASWISGSECATALSARRRARPRSNCLYNSRSLLYSSYVPLARIGSAILSILDSTQS